MKTMLITGSSRGIGAATAILAARYGYRIILNYHTNEAAAEDVAAKILSEGGKAIVVQADISKESEVQHLFLEADRLMGRIDVLVNNAGILFEQTTCENISLERFSKLINTNLMGSFLCAKEAIKRMAFRYGGKGGTIVNVSSLAAKTGAPFEYIDYAASKAAIDSMSLGLAKELAADGIRVNSVRPAMIETGIHATGGEPERIQRMKNLIPLGRGGKADEVAEAIVWLACEKSSYCTGTFIDIAGGFASL